MIEAKKILIVGDSFSVYDAHKDQECHGWSAMLSRCFHVTNLSAAGVGEYKILKQIESCDLNRYDCIIVSHTSPNRVHIDHHPVHRLSESHQNADLIYQDVIWHLQTYADDPVLQTAKNYFIHIYDQQYHDDLYRLMQEKIVSLTGDRRCLHLLTLTDNNHELFRDYLNLYQLFAISPGSPNHYDKITNQKIYNLVTNWINCG